MSLFKYWYKYTNKNKYFELKEQQRGIKQVEIYTNLFKPILQNIRTNIKTKNELNFLHSGHLGDVIYALPILKELSKTHKCNLYLQENKPLEEYYHKHPAGNVFLNSKLVNWLIPLLEKQKYIHKVEKFSHQIIDINFDEYRNMPVDFSWLSFRWFFQLTGIHADIENSWLEIESHKTLRKKIVIVRSFRARNYFIDYSFLKNYNELLFIGLKEEYEDLKKQVPNLEFYVCKDFLEMAQIIKESKFFLGNQSFAYALAEGLKVPRLLEANPDFPVVHPVGKNGKDFYFQEDFEDFFEEFYKL